MRRMLVVTASSLLVLSVPATADAIPSNVKAKYQRAYHAVALKFGARAPGRNIVRWGMSSGRAATTADVQKSMGVLERMLAPAPVVTTTPVHTGFYAPVATTPTATYSAPTMSSYGGGSGGLPACTWVPESGGNWNAVNPSSGAYGRYQIMPGTARDYGCNLSTHDGQTACAVKIYAGGRGAGNWVNC